MPEITELQVASGRDNTAGMLALAALSPPLFWANSLGVQTKWYASEADDRVDGDLRARRVGLPWVKLVLQVVSEEEAALIDTLVGDVTINCRVKHGAVWKTFNGRLWPPTWGDFTQRSGYFIDVEVTVHGLEEIP